MKVSRTSIALFVALIFAIAANGAHAAGLQGKLDKGGGSPPKVRSGNSLLPQKGDIAVIVEGAEEHHVGTAEAMIVQTLIKHGYRVVDEAQMKKMRADAASAQAARYALEGNVAGILKLNANYNAAATIVASVSAGEGVENEFKLYTASAYISLVAVTSNGTKLGGETSRAKQVGYSADEAQMKALEAAVEQAMAEIM